MVPTRICRLAAALIVGLLSSYSVLVLAQPSSEDCSLRVEGEISASTASLVDRIPRSCDQPFVFFDSPGGDVFAALRIGKTLREREASTAVGIHSTCASACVLAFVGGVQRMAPGRIGLHRPFSNRASSSLNESDASYRGINTRIATFLKSMNLPVDLLNAMNAVPPQEIRWLSTKEKELYQIDGSDPVWTDLRDSRRASQIGISKREYYERWSTAKSQCNTIKEGTEYSQCVWSIVDPRGRLR